jgi:hypothetical protein
LGEGSSQARLQLNGGMDHFSIEPGSEHRIEIEVPDGYDVRFDYLGSEWEKIEVFYDRLYWFNRYLLITAYDVLVEQEEVVTVLNPVLLLEMRTRQFAQGKTKIEYILTNL